MVTNIVIVVVALVFSAFFSGMEIAFVSSNKLKLEIEKKNNRVFASIVGVFTKHPGQYITTILVGNNIALVVYSLNMTILLNLLFTDWGLHLGQGSIIAETIISTIIIIFTAEFTPKAVVNINPNFYLKAFAVPVYLIYIILYPIAKATTMLSVALLRMTGLRLKGHNHMRTFDRVDLANLLEEASDNEHNQENEIRIFQNALDFSDLRVRDCMIPRVDIEAVDIEDGIAELSARFLQTQYSRIFVYEASIDNIIGYVNTKSLFRAPKTIREVIIPVGYVPETMPAQKLLTYFTKKKQSAAVVIDEFGGTAGMATMEDVLEEIFGEIEDEHDSPDLIEKAVGENAYVFSCRLEVDYLNEKYDLEITESDEYDTLAGYIIFNHQGLPVQGETLVIERMEIKVLKVSGSKLDLVRLKIMK